MPVVPDQINAKIQFFEQRIASWKASHEDLGLTESQCDAMQLLITSCRTAYNNAQAARIAAKNATITQTSAVRAMSNMGADLISFIRAFADSQATPEARDAVYATASVPPPSAPSPAGPPVAPTMVSADPNADGTVTVKWKGSTSNQTFFSIWRKVGNSTMWSQIGSVATKSFIDATVPGGTPTVTYFIRAQRNNQISPASDETIVNFGQALAA